MLKATDSVATAVDRGVRTERRTRAAPLAAQDRGGQVGHKDRTADEATASRDDAGSRDGPLAGALIGYGVFAILVVMIASLFAGNEFSLPAEEWKSLGFGASILAGLLLFIGYTYGGLIAGRLGGGGQREIALGLAVFIAGIALALFAGWAVSAATSGDHADRTGGRQVDPLGSHLWVAGVRLGVIRRSGRSGSHQNPFR